MTSNTKLPPLLPETELIVLLKEGNEDAFRELVSVYGDRIYNTVLSLIQQHEDAEDIVQDVFIQVFRAVGGFAGDSSLSTWIYRIAVNRSLDKLRAEKRKKRTIFFSSLFGSEKDLKADFYHPGVAAEQKENAAVLFSAVRKLPEAQQAAFTLNKAAGLTYRETGDVLGISESAVDSLLQRARQNLKKMPEIKNLR